MKTRKIVSLSGKKGYLSLIDIGYDQPDGFKGIYCRHDWFPFAEGISERAYTDKELKELNNQTVRYNGKDIKIYDARQMQRKMEADIREDKRQIAGYNGILTSNTDNKELIEEVKSRFALKSVELKQKESMLKDFSEQTGLKRDRARERINRFDKSASKNNIFDFKKLTTDEEGAIIKYISPDSYILNDKLRNNIELTQQEIKWRDNLDCALKKCENYKGNVVRVLDIKNKKELEKFISYNEINKPVTYNEYLSFSNKGNYNEDGNVFIYTTSTKGKDLRKFNQEESEIVYVRNSKFYVENVIKKNNKVYILWRELDE